MIFNNVLNERSLEHAHAVCSFYDPYIGEDAGYLQVTRLNGHGPVLLVLPYGNTPLEAYNPILDAHGAAEPSIFRDPTPRGITFEGFYDWMVHSAAYAENEWKPGDAVESSDESHAGARRIEDVWSGICNGRLDPKYRKDSC